MLFRRNSKLHNAQILRKLHIAACIFGALLSVYCLLSCIAVLYAALHEWSKYRDLGFSYTFHYHLNNNGFYREVILLFGVAIEWLHYFLQYHRAHEKKKTAGSVWIFSILLVVHIAVWLNARSLPLPDLPSWELAELPVVLYRRFSNMTILPSIFYFTVYFLRTRNLDS